MIKEQNSVSMAEAVEYIKKDESGETDTLGFVKKFVKLKPADAKALREKLEILDLMKVKSEHISKIIDLLPENKEELNKIFVEIGLDEDETNKILDAVKEFK